MFLQKIQVQLPPQITLYLLKQPSLQQKSSAAASTIAIPRNKYGAVDVNAHVPAHIRAHRCLVILLRLKLPAHMIPGPISSPSNPSLKPIVMYLWMLEAVLF